PVAAAPIWGSAARAAAAGRAPRRAHCPPAAPPPCAAPHREASNWATKGKPPRKYTDRVGGWLTPAALPHHRTCGSASGGSTSTLESLLLAQQREQPQAREVNRRNSLVHMGRSSVPPRATTVHGTAPGALGIKTQGAECAPTSPGPFPLPPQQTAQPSPHPPIEFLQNPFGLRELEVMDPASQEGVQGLDCVGE